MSLFWALVAVMCGLFTAFLGAYVTRTVTGLAVALWLGPVGITFALSLTGVSLPSPPVAWLTLPLIKFLLGLTLFLVGFMLWRVALAVSLATYLAWVTSSVLHGQLWGPPPEFITLTMVIVLTPLIYVLNRDLPGISMSILGGTLVASALTPYAGLTPSWCVGLAVILTASVRVVRSASPNPLKLKRGFKVTQSGRRSSSLV